jgi:hypothetical protein
MIASVAGTRRTDFNAHFLVTAICHSEGALAATEESLLSLSGILRSAQDDILEMTCHECMRNSQVLQPYFGQSWNCNLDVG